MSIPFSNTTTKNGIIQGIERTIFGNDGDGRISGNSTLLAQFTGDVNLALDKAFQVIFGADGRWQFDDTNHSDYPIITTNLVANQRDYTFTSDANSNLVLEIQRVLVADTAGVFHEVSPVDAQTESDTDGFWDGRNGTGTPNRYDKTANGIFLDPIPSYNYSAGLKIYISREGSYFTTADTTKKPGIAGIFHEYFIVNPAYKYAYRNTLSNVGDLRNEMLRLEAEMAAFYARRAKDEERRLIIGGQNNK